MKLRGATTAALILVAALARADSIPVATEWAAGTNWQYHDDYRGLKGTWVYTPASTSPGAPGRRGVVFALMGCGQVATQLAQGGGWAAPAETYGMYIVVPATIDPVRPNPLAQSQECFKYGVNNIKPTPESPDHKALIAAARAMVADATLNVDPSQIYGAGLSAGGTVALQLSCMAPELFAGAAVAAAPSMGSNQSQAVTGVSVTAAQVKQTCLEYANASGNAAALKDHVYAFISDDNFENPLGVSVTGDADNFCPHEYNHLNAQVFAEILELTAAGTAQSIGCSGQGAICGHTPRPWEAKADLYKDAAGLTRLVRIEQDTLGHAWPSGTTAETDKVAPSVAAVKAKGYVDATCRYAMAATSAKNGDVGVLYFNPVVANTTSVDFATFALGVFSENNPRLRGGAPDGGTGTCVGVTCPAGETCASGRCACSATSCPAGQVCDETTKQCVAPRTCQSGCPATEPCNSAHGVCECSPTSCQAGFICSASTKRCLAGGSGCGTCRAEETCDPQSNTCVRQGAAAKDVVGTEGFGCRSVGGEPALVLAIVLAGGLAARRRRR